MGSDRGDRQSTNKCCTRSIHVGRVTVLPVTSSFSLIETQKIVLNIRHFSICTGTIEGYVPTSRFIRSTSTAFSASCARAASSAAASASAHRPTSSAASSTPLRHASSCSCAACIGFCTKPPMLSAEGSATTSLEQVETFKDFQDYFLDVRQEKIRHAERSSHTCPAGSSAKRKGAAEI